MNRTRVRGPPSGKTRNRTRCLSAEPASPACDKYSPLGPGKSTAPTGATVSLRSRGCLVAWRRLGFAEPSPSREGSGTLPGFPIQSKAEDGAHVVEGGGAAGNPQGGAHGAEREGVTG